MGIELSHLAACRSGAIGLSLLAVVRVGSAAPPTAPDPSEVPGATPDLGAPYGVKTAQRISADSRRHATTASSTTPQTTKSAAAASPASSVEVTVTGKRPLSRDRAEDATVIAGDRLRSATQPTLLSAMASESAGLYVNSTAALHGVSNGASGGVFMRGLGGSPNSQILVVEDGVPDYQGIFGHPIPDAYVPALIEDALIEKGGDSVLYGSNAMGGVIALRSRFRTENGYELVNDSAYGSFDTLRETVSILGRSDRWDGAAAVHAMSTAGHRSGTAGRLLVGNGSVRVRLSNELSLALRNRSVHLQGADPGPASHPYSNHFYDVWRNNSSLGIEWNRGNLRLSITPAFNAGVHHLYDGFRSVDIVAGTRGEIAYRFAPASELLVGVDQHHVAGDVENRATLTETPVNAINDVSVYGQMTVRPIAPMSLVLGARELYSDKYGAITLYKAGLHFRIYRGLSVHTRIARNFRQPTLRELYLPFPSANPDLRPEYALNWDAGLSYVSEHLEGSASLYRTAARDLIRYFGVWPAAEVVNIDRITVWGTEALLRLRRYGPVSAFASLDHKGVGRFTRQNPSTKANLGIELTYDFGIDQAFVGVTAEWVTGLYMANYHRQPMADVFVVDGQLRFRHVDAARSLTLEPYLLLRNLLDHRYAYIADYPMPGFNVLAGMRVTV